MSIEVLTKEDLQVFRQELLDEIRKLVKPQDAGVKPWLKNAEVKKLLNISSNTVQRLRISGKLPSKKVGGIHYYSREVIEKLLSSDAA